MEGRGEEEGDSKSRVPFFGTPIKDRGIQHSGAPMNRDQKFLVWRLCGIVTNTRGFS